MAPIDLGNTIAAIAALGTAAYGLVDSSKAVYGGISNAGFTYIREAVIWMFPGDPTVDDRKTPLGLGAVLDTLRANWLNGMAMADQKLVAKTLIKLRLNEDNAGSLATKMGVDPAGLARIAKKIAIGEPLDPPEADLFGRFDLILATALDEGYQRADQRYRNWCKAAAVPVAVVVAVLAGWAIESTAVTSTGAPKYTGFPAYLGSYDAFKAFVIGLIATPLAPIAKDLASAVQQASKAVQAWRS